MGVIYKAEDTHQEVIVPKEEGNEGNRILANQS